MDPLDATWEVPLMEEAIPMLERGARYMARAGTRVYNAARTRAAMTPAASRISPRVGIGTTEALKRQMAREGTIDLEDALVTAAGARGIYKASKSAYDSLFGARKRTMKSWRKRAADFGQWERRVKRRTLKNLGYKYRTKSTKRSPATKVGGTGGKTIVGRGKKFRKPRRVRPVSKMITRKFDDHGQVTSDFCAWLNIEGNGCQSRMWKMCADAVVRAVLAKVGVYPESLNQPIGNNSFFVPNAPPTEHVTLVINYLQVHPGDGDSSFDDSTHIVFRSSTSTYNSLHAISTDVANTFKTMAAAGKFPEIAYLKNESTSTYLTNNIDLTKAIFTYNCHQRIDLQNQSEATAGADIADANNIHAVELKGKIYKFKHSQANIHNRLREEDTGFDVFADDDTTDGVVTLQPTAGTSHYLKHPQAARTLFTNCASVTDITLKPGESRYFREVLKFKGTLKQFFMKNMNRTTTTVGASTLSFGSRFVVALECAIRSNNAAVDVAYNREVTSTAFLQLRPVRHNLIQYEDNAT